MSGCATERRVVEWTRRQVLRGGAAGAAALAMSGCRRAAAEARPSGLVVGPGRNKLQEEQDAALGVTGVEHHVLAMLDLDEPAAGPRLVPMTFFGHGVVFDPRDPARALVFEKKGPGACEVDLARAVVTRPIETTREFYGHGAFAPDGSVFFDTETVVEDDYRGVVVVRDARTLAEIGEFPTYGAAPHDCRLVDGGRTLVVTNGGARRPGGTPPSVTYVDVRTEELLEELRFESADVTAGHLTLTGRGDLAVSSSIRPWLPEESPGAVSFRPAGGAFRTMTEPAEVTARMLGESLSVAVHEPSGIAGVTNPKGNVVTFWDLAAGRFLRALDFAYPRGIHVTLDETHFVVSYGEKSSLIYVSPETLEPLADSRVPATHITGSHVFLHRMASASS